MHYTNPSRSTTIIDNSGISLGVTSLLQTNEAAITTTGPVFEQFLIRVPAMRVRVHEVESARGCKCMRALEASELVCGTCEDPTSEMSIE